VDRDPPGLAERSRGDTLREIAERHSLSPGTLRLIVTHEGRKQTDDPELRLLLNRKGGVELFLIPDHGGPDLTGCS
jgi:hypothetical protein